MKTIAVYNHKGGVGKTATAVNLAYMSALEGYETLLWDMDAQAASTFYFRLQPELGCSAKKMLTGKHALADLLRATDYPFLDILPGDAAMRHQDLFLDQNEKPAKRVKKLLAPLAIHYDYVFIDCAPSLSVTSESIFAAADLILLPTIPTTLSMITLEKVHDFFRQRQLDTRQLLAFFSMADQRRILHKQLIQQGPEQFRFARTMIPYLSDIEKMGIEKRPAGAIAGNRAFALYEQLWDELNELTSSPP